MKLYRKVDNNGLFIEDVILDEIPYKYDEEGNKIYDPHYIDIEVPNGFYKPKWNGIMWIEGMSKEEIDAIKNVEVEQPLEVRNRSDIDYLSIMMGVELNVG